MTQHHEERVERDAFRKNGPRWFIAAGRHSQENWGVTQWINDREQSANNQQNRTRKLGDVGPDHRVALTSRFLQMPAEYITHGRSSLS